jgi:Zn-dependent protease with chaperone function
MSAATALSMSADSADARRYNRLRRWSGIADFVIGLVVMVALLFTGWSGDLRDLAYQMAFQHYTVALFLFLFMLMVIGKVVGGGLDYYNYRLEHRYHLSNQKFRSWLRDQVKSFVVGLVLAFIVVESLYLIIRHFPQYWWAVTWLVFLGFFVLLAQIAPVVLFPIFYKFAPLENEELKQRLVRLSERAGTRVRGVYEWRLSEKSTKANAALTGLGNTRRIILADTLLHNYSPDEIEAVLAHELGHHVHKHIMKSIAVQALITFAGFWLASGVMHYSIERLHMFETLSDFANLPLFVLVSTLFSVLLMPLLNAYSRYNEREADRYCFKSVPSVQPFISAMNKLAEQNLAERTPSKLVEMLFHSHPSVGKRIAAAEAWLSHKPVSPA